MTRVAVLPLVLLALAWPWRAAAQTPAPARNAFAGVETVILTNGLKVWFKRLPGDPIVSVSVTVPAGLDQDPPGLEHLSHFTEHMMFSGQPGHSEADVKREVDERGGARNAYTTDDHTLYFVQVGKAHGTFAIQWMYRLVSPHAMDPAVVERQREPVALEVRARPRQAIDLLVAKFLNPPALRMPDFWAREFGMSTPDARDVDLWESVHRISSADLRGFYDRYYVPSRMTLTVIGDLDRDSTMAVINATFASWPARAAPADTQSLRDPGRRHANYAWDFRSNVYHDLQYRLPRLAVHDRVTAIFLSRWLGKRLNERLRFGDNKVSYGLRVGVTWRESAGYLYVNGGIKASEYAFARRVVEDEFQALHAGTRSDSAFIADRDAVASALRVQDASAKELERWVMSDFYDPRIVRDYPDLVHAFETMKKSDVEDFARRHLAPEAQVLDVTYPVSVSQGVLVLFVIAAAILGIRIARRLLMRPLDMTRLRYVARFRIPALYWVSVVPLLIVLVACAFRLLVFALMILNQRFVAPVDNFWIQFTIDAALAVALFILFVAVLGRVPRKLLCFQDGVAIKYLAYRSVRIDAGDIAEVELRPFADVWLSRRIFSCMPLALGILRPAIHLRRASGRSYYFHVRDDAECLRVLDQRS